MITYVITPDGSIMQDTPRTRKGIFDYLQEYTGDEWTSELREDFAKRDWGQSLDCRSETPWKVTYDNRSVGATKAITEAEFRHEKAAEEYTHRRNTELITRFIANDANFCRLDLPDNIFPDMTAVCVGSYPLSRYVFCYLSLGARTVRSRCSWDACGVTDFRPMPALIKQTLVDLLQDLASPEEDPHQSSTIPDRE
jgi:hypothetical protein